MERLPVEILYKIGAHLDKNDQLNCTRVCRLWKNMMEKHILYRLVHIYSEYRLHKLKRLVIKYPHIADRIEQLVLFFDHGAILINIRGLLSMLLNVREIICYDISQVRVSVDSTKRYPFHKRIQRISEPKASSMTCCLLSQGTCLRLTTLKIRDLTCANIELLKNAPALKTLELCNGTIFLGHIDCIYRNTPVLVSLKVYHLIVTEITLGDLVDPAIAITEFGFRIFSFKSGGSGAILFQYICRKYPNLAHLIYQANHFSFEVLTNSGLRDTLSTSLIQQFGPQLKKLSNIQVTDSGTDIFSVMEMYNVQLDYLSLYDFKRHVLQILARSTQSLCLQSLELITSDNMSFEWLKELSMLKRLKLIDLSQTHINLSKTLANAPLTLRSLHIIAEYLVKDPEYVEAFNIEELCFDGVQVNINPDTYFSHHFPKLTSLTLKNPDPFNIRLNLSNIRLYEFRVYYLETRVGRYFVYISTEKEGRVEKKLYYVKKKHCDLTNVDERFLPAPRILPLDSTTGYVSTIDLICRSVNRVILT